MFDHLADTKKLITETDWQGLSETAYEKVTAGLETAVGSIEDSHKKAANWLIEGAQQEKPWAWFGNQITDASEYAWNGYTNTVEDVADDIADLFKETKEDLESIADISVKLFEHRDDIFLFFQNISNANTSDIANFIDTVIADIDPELARSIKEDTDSYGVFLELINDDAGRIFLSYLGLIIGAVPPNFYAFLYGAAAAYIILEVLFCILLAFISGGLAVAARFAAIIARIAVMGMKVTAVNQRIASGARAVSAYIDSLKVIESSLKQLKAIGANTRRIKLKGQKASGSTGETLVIERKVVPNNNLLRQTGGGSGDIDPADQLYDAIRVSETDVGAIAANTGIKPQNIQKVKDHVFHNEHLLDRYVDLGEPAVVARFDSNLAQADAWKRLESGAHVDADITWLKHETAERWYELKYNSGYTEAHDRVDWRWNGNPWEIDQ